MVIYIKNILLYFYNFNDINDYVSGYFFYNNNYYLLKEIDSFNFFNYNNSFLHQIINNIYNYPVTIYDNKKYVLLKVNYKEKNRNIELQDIIKISKIINFSTFKFNYYEIWTKKIDFIEKYIKETGVKNNDIYYYLELSDIAINMIKKINFNNITYGITYNRFNIIKSLYDLYDPFIIKNGPIVNGFAEYIKYLFFHEHKNEDYNELFNLNISLDDWSLFAARLLFPTYYFDLLKTDNNYLEYENILNNIDNYLDYIKKIFLEIKKRHNEMSYLEYIINLL